MMNEESLNLATLPRQPKNRSVSAAEIRLDWCEVDGRRLADISRWELSSGTWRKTSKCIRIPASELDIVIGALERARGLAKPS